MHSEDYVHRIGRTGRAHAIGDAISFITPEDQGPLRSLERFIGRGSCERRPKDSITTWPRLHAITGESVGRGSNRGCREILRAEAATPCNAIMAGLHVAFHRRVLREDHSEDIANRSFGAIE